MKKTYVFYYYDQFAEYVCFARFDTVNRRGMNGDEVRKATAIIAGMTGVGSWNILAGDWNRTHTRFMLSNGRHFHFHPKFNEICAALEREYEQLRGHARYRRDANPLHSEDGLLIQGTSDIYSARKERKYGKAVLWRPIPGAFARGTHLVVHPGDRAYPELAEEEGTAVGLSGSGAIYAA